MREYDEIVEQIYDLPKFRDEMSLAPIQELMQELDNPHQAFDVVHVAGTNGKGSTCTIVAAILDAADYDVGLFTSPHLESFRERIRVNGEKISEEAVVAWFEQMEDVIAAADASFFETLTAMAFLQFAEQGVDVAVVETGMGGELDATNVVEPEIAAITNVAKEHTRILGDPMESIARKKAGIVEEGRPIVCGAEGRAVEVVQEVAEGKDARFVTVKRYAEIENTTPSLEVSVDGTSIETGLTGKYQIANLNTALTAIQELDDYSVEDEAVRSGLEAVEMPGRMEVVEESPLTILDGAHNPAAVEKLVESISDVGDSRIVAIVSIMEDKEYEEMLAILEGVVDTFVLSEAAIERAADPDRLDKAVERAEVVVKDDIDEALTKAREQVGRDAVLLVTGSLYFVGDVRQRLSRGKGL